MNRIHARLTATALALSIAGFASAQTAQPSPSSGMGQTGQAGQTGSSGSSGQAGSGQLARADAAFLKDATQASLAEIEGSKLAVSKATSPQVKAFADQMITDHTKMSEQVKALAASKKVELPTEPSMKQKAELKLIDTAKGASFDERYASRIGVASHEDTVKLFRKASTDAKDPEVKKLATEALPQLEHHLKMAQELKASTAKGSAGRATSSEQAQR